MLQRIISFHTTTKTKSLKEKKSMFNRSNCKGGGLLSPSICISICIVESWSLGISGKLSKLVYSGCILFITVLVLWWVTYNIKPGLTTILDLGYWVTGLPTVLDLGYLQYYTWAPYILDLGYWVTILGLGYWVTYSIRPGLSTILNLGSLQY